MNRRELVRGVAAKLRENNMKKSVRAPRHVFHISDDSGNTKDFVVKQAERSYIYTEDDVDKIVDALVDVILDALKIGDTVSIHGFGAIGVKYRQARRTRDPKTGEWVDIEGHYIPKLTFGKDMKTAAKLYELSIDEDKELPYRYEDIAIEE